MKICVLQPDYSTSKVDYQNYDPPRNLSPLFPEAEMDHVLLNKLTTYKQLKQLRKNNYDIFVNLCEGYLDWEIPSIDVITSLELLGLPFTGPTSKLYDPSKVLMKYVAYCEAVKTAPYVLVRAETEIELALQQLAFPLFVKPAGAGDSLGIDLRSKVSSRQELEEKVKELLPDYDEVLVEEYIDGREFTVLVCGSSVPGQPCNALKPIEFIFPRGNQFKTYALKTSELHPEANIPVAEEYLDLELRNAAEKIFTAFNGVGYARLDFRMNSAGELFFLEINFTCSVFYSDGYEGSADYILRHDGMGQGGFLRQIIAEGIGRFKSRQPCYHLRGNAIAGFGIYASRDIQIAEIIFPGEEKAQRIATLRHIEKCWSGKQKEIFRHYAYPISEEVFLLWDTNPEEWAPQNHSCDPNTFYEGLNVCAKRPIAAGEELTLDYACFLNEMMEPFMCNCGAKNCRGQVKGSELNSITSR